MAQKKMIKKRGILSYHMTLTKKNIGILILDTDKIVKKGQ